MKQTKGDTVNTASYPNNYKNEKMHKPQYSETWNLKLNIILSHFDLRFNE